MSSPDEQGAAAEAPLTLAAFARMPITRLKGVGEKREKAFAASGERRGLGGGLGGREGGGIGVLPEFGRRNEGGRAELNVVADAAPFFRAGGFGLGVEVGATGGDPIAKLVGGDRSVFFAVAADNGEHERKKTGGRRGVNGVGGASYGGAPKP